MGRGSSKAGGNPTGGVTAAQRRAVDRIANKTRNLKNEQEHIVNEDGEVVAEARGGRGEVAMTVGTRREYMRGAVDIHNHPENGGEMGGTFSDADLDSFGYGAREIVVAAPEGTYILTNTRYGQPNQYDGWVDMRDASRAAGVFDVADNLGMTEINNRARQNPRVQRLAERSSNIANEWVSQRNAGASQSVLDGLMAEHNAVSEQLSQATRLARSQVVLTPAHEWYTQNARRYGFNYQFIPKGENVYKK